ncbi:MAG: LysM peptidoglycan-binding domain-containing protein, partial [Oscillospiraceae bacterium]|nr:LysM peptidoglycan-binding domain-containing protein [Oscillospiraceae bacterium]
MKKRLVSLVMALCLTVTLFAGLGTTAYAAEDTVKGYLVSYTVKAGDTIFGICEKLGIDFDKNLQMIAKINGLINFNYLVPGKVLWMPSSTASTSSAYYTLLQHTLVAGEAPAALCQSYGIDYNKSLTMLSGLNENFYAFMAGTNILLPLYVNPTGTAVTEATAAAAA